MNFEFDETQKNLRKTMAAFFQTEILPGAAALDTCSKEQVAAAIRANLK